MNSKQVPGRKTPSPLGLSKGRGSDTALEKLGGHGLGRCGGLGGAAQRVAAVANRLYSPRLGVVAVVVASGRHAAINAGMGRWLSDDALLNQQLHAVHGGVLELSHQTGTGMATFRRLGAVRWLATVDAGCLTWGAESKRAASDLHLRSLLWVGWRPRLDKRVQGDFPTGEVAHCQHVFGRYAVIGKLADAAQRHAKVIGESRSPAPFSVKPCFKFQHGLSLEHS